MDHMVGSYIKVGDINDARVDKAVQLVKSSLTKDSTTTYFSPLAVYRQLVNGVN